MRGAIVRILRSPGSMVLFGLLVRLVCCLLTRSYHFDGLWSLFETANIGRSLATGHGYSNPYDITTGPSALIPPAYPWIVSLAFRAFGVFSYSAGFAIVVFNSVFSALTSWTVYRIAQRVFNENIAVWAGWIWAIWPFAIYYSVDWIWDTSLSAFLLSLLFLLTLEKEGDERWSWWLGYGALWGIVALTNTSLLAWLPFSGCWLAYQLRRSSKRFLARVVVSAAAFWLVLTPWLVRNYLVFGRPAFIRDNFGNELRGGNNEYSEGVKVLNYDSGRDEHLLILYQQMGELAINEQQYEDAKAWIADHPSRFVVLCFRRFFLFWGGIVQGWEGLGLVRRVKELLYPATSLLAFGGLFLAYRRRVHGFFLLATLLLFYPLTYYITVAEIRYRHAIEPELLMLAMFLVVSLSKRLPHADEGTAQRCQSAAGSSHS